MTPDDRLDDESGLISEGLGSLDGEAETLFLEWNESRMLNDDADALSSMYEFAKRKLCLRDGGFPGSSSRRASLDPAKDEVIREIARGLEKKKSDYVASFIKEWIDMETCLSSSSASSPSVVSCLAQNEEALDQIVSWDTDFLSLSEPELIHRSIKVYKLWGFCTELVAKQKLDSFIRLIARNYRSENPYHNFHHAHSVMAITGNMLYKTCRGVFTQMEEFAILTAALCHDVGHRGLNSDYYIKTHHPLAIQYNDISVLENMHCSLTFELLRSSEAVDFSKGWSDEEFTQFRRVLIQSIMATDMKVHFDLTAGIQKMTCVDGESKKLVYQSIVHAADLANPLMPTKASFQWAFRVVEEMFEQGRLEEQDGFTVAPFMKYPPTETLEFAKLQVSFVQFIVAPLWRSMAVVWPSLQDRIDQMETNLKFWESLRDKNERSV